jgi:hypothetical protein
MNRKLIFLCACLFFAAACLTTATPGSDAVNTEVARQLTSMSLLTQSGGTALGPSQDSGAPGGDLPTVTQTSLPPETPTSTVTPTVTPTASFTPPADDPALALGPATYRTDFTNLYGWYMYEDDNVRFEIVDQKLVMTAKQANTTDWYTRTVWELSNYYIEMTATPDTCSGRDRYGLVVGVPYPDVTLSFWVKVTCDGYYSFSYQDTEIDYKFHYIKDWTKSPYIYAGPGQSNRVGFKAEGTHLSLYANGHFLTDLDEPSFVEGRFGLFVGSVNTPNFVVRVSEVAYWVLP